ncbi:MAG: hypothetical protein AMXMBFR84_12980 [Candidatus Hydrogenedentota bacterium]
MTMSIVAIAYGLALAALGIGFYLNTGGVSVTALIPAFFGFPVLVCGLLAIREKFRMHAMHGAVLVGLLGFLGSLGGVIKLPGLIAGTLERPAAVLEQVIMAVLSLVFVALCVQNFISVRRKRKAAQAAESK